MAGNNSIQLLRGSSGALRTSSSLAAGQPCYVTDLHTLVVSEKRPINASTRLLTSATSTDATEIRFLRVKFTSGGAEQIIPIEMQGSAAGQTFSSFNGVITAGSHGRLLDNINGGRLIIPVPDNNSVNNYRSVIVYSNNNYTGVYANGATTAGGIAINLFNTFTLV